MHPVHVSITNLDYMPEQNKITLSFKVFQDDFQLLFAHLYQVSINFDDHENYKNYQNRVDEYFSSHFKIIEGEDKKHLISYKGMKKNEESIWFYYETLVDKEIEYLEIVNTILLDLYFDQKNMLILNHNGKEKGYLFNLKQTKQIIKLNDF
jgi:hypothetical protein